MKTALLIAAPALLLIGCNPKPYEVKREIVIDAPAEVIFAEINNLKAQEAWSPWEEKDPNSERTYEGPEEGVGAKYSWKGNDEVGTGSMEILEITPNTYIKTNLIFTDPWESESVIEWHFEPAEGGIKATWKVLGELPGYLFWMGEKSMDEMMGPEFEKGLAKLKVLAEEKAVPVYDVTVVEVQSAPYYYIPKTVALSEVNDALFSSSYQQLAAYLGPDAADISAPAFAVVHEWDEEKGQTSMEISFACESKKIGNDEIKKGTTYGGTAVMVRHNGPVDGTGVAHEFLHEYITQSGYTFAGSPWESYVVGPNANPNPDEWITEIYYPVMPKAAVQ